MTLSNAALPLLMISHNELEIRDKTSISFVVAEYVLLKSYLIHKVSVTLLAHKVMYVITVLV